mgnify:FL=1
MRCGGSKGTEESAVSTASVRAGSAVSRRYPSIGDYGFIGDGRTAALVSRDGSIDWLCLPHFFSPSLFAALVDVERGGRFQIRPAEPYAVSRRYRDDALVLETTFTTERGVLRLTDCLVLLHHSPLMNELQPSRELLRRIEVLKGEVNVEVWFAPRPDYGRRPSSLEWRRGLGWTVPVNHGRVLLQAECPLEQAAGAALQGRLRLQVGDARHFSLAMAHQDMLVAPPLGEHAHLRLLATMEWWRHWGESFSYSGPYREQVFRSSMVLKALTYALSGAVVAAPTSSLPEAPGTARNWDYRYCWLRDAAFTLRAFDDIGFHQAGADFFSWLLHATRLTWPELKVLYDVHGEQPQPEQELSHLEGYRGAAPVRIGNGADEQLQLDIYGEVLLAAYDYARRHGALDRFESRLLLGFGRTVCRRWREPDHGIWEVRGVPRHYTYSKMMCWVALDCLLRLHREGYLDIDVEAFRAERDAIAAAIEARGFNETLNAYVAVFEGDEPDAALLQFVRVGYIDAEHPRMAGTYKLIRDRLMENGLVRRYPPDFDGLAGEEGAFGVCCFWMVEYLVLAGRCDEARELFEHVLGFANDLDLFAEEIDPRSGELLGNFPQAFTHIGLIAAALALAGVDSGEEDSND